MSATRSAGLPPWNGASGRPWDANGGLACLNIMVGLAGPAGPSLVDLDLIWAKPSGTLFRPLCMRDL